MEKTVPELIAAISPEEWAQVPLSVLCLGLFHERETRSERLRQLIEELVRRMDKIEQEMAALRTENELLKEQLARTSANSSQPPSKNPQGFKPNRKGKWSKDSGSLSWSASVILSIKSSQEITFSIASNGSLSDSLASNSA
jgi:hypothetical protein